MSKRALGFLLAVSLAVNVFVVAGVVYTVYKEQHATASPEGRVDLVADELGLTAEQREALALLRERSAIRRSAMKETLSPAQAAVLQQVSEPSFDRDRVKALIAEWNEERQLYYLTSSEDLHEFLMTLTPEQRRSFLAMAREREFMRQVFRGAKTASAN